MENLPSINEILENKYFQIGMIVWVVFFSGCITEMIPDEFRRILNNPVARVAVLAVVVYLADKNFRLAVVIATAFFLSTAPMNVKEGMATSCNDPCDVNFLRTKCTDDSCCHYLDNATILKPIDQKCVKKCDNNQPTADKCKNHCGIYKKYDNASNSITTDDHCYIKCSEATTDDACNSLGTHCQWATIGQEEKCMTKCNQQTTKDNCTNAVNSQYCQWTNDRCQTKQ